MKKKIILLLLTIIISIGLITVNADNNNTFSYIDYPTNNQEVTDNLKVQGWVMSTLNTTIKAYIDYQEIELDRVERPDVLNGIKGYGDITTNPTPGFAKDINLNSYGYGGHIFKINVIDSNNNIIDTKSRTFIKTTPKTLINIDFPTVNNEVTDNLKVLGWIMSTTNTSIKVFIDNTEVSVDRERRQDVLNAIKGYGDITTNPTPGFIKNINISNLSYGKHVVKINAYDSNNNLIQQTSRSFIKTSPKTITNIDYPTNKDEVTDNLRIQGWVMSTINTNVRVFIDYQEVQVDRTYRGDVLNGVKGYGDVTTNPLPGIFKNVNISNYSYGTHTLKINVYDSSNNLIQTTTRNFTKVKPKTLINIDFPSVNKEVTDSLRVLGWLMSTTNTTMKAYIDNNEISIDRERRPDVLNGIKGYGDNTTNPNPGFTKIINISNYSYGTHILKINVYDSSNNLIKTTTRNFIKVKPKTLINIDFPTANGEVTDNLKVQGWVMSTANTIVKVFMDNQEITVDRTYRGDVLNGVKGYGDVTTNPTPGFFKNIDISQKGYGTHSIKINVYDSNNNLIQTTTRNYTKVKPKAIINIDFPTPSVEGTTTKILGWYLVNTTKAKVEMYLDGNLIDFNNFVERPDVYKVYKGQYGYDTIKPGFLINYNSTNLLDGTHTLLIKVVSTTNNQIIASSSKTFTLKKVKGTLTIDNLYQNTKQESYFLDGWEMSTEKDSYVKIYVDNNLISDEINRNARPDVISAIKNYGNQSVNPTPGFNTYLNITNITTGSHTIRIELYSKYNEVIASQTRRINIYSKDYIRNGNTITGLRYNVPYYNQYDSRWKDIPYGISTFGPRGCAPTAMAMAFSGIKGIEIHPNEVADYLFYNTREFNRNVPGTSGLGIVYATNYYGIKRYGINSKNDLDNALKSGQIVFAAMGNGIYATAFWNHAIILKGYNNGNTYSYDPLDTSKNMWVNTSTIWSQRSVDSDDYRGGSVFYALESKN